MKVEEYWHETIQNYRYDGDVSVHACPRLEVIKQSVCIEGARRAFARAKMHWGKLDAEQLDKDGPPKGKEHRYPKMYYSGIMKGARLVASECPKNIIFE